MPFPARACIKLCRVCAQVALRWFCSRSLLKAEGLTKELIDRIPGKQTDRKTPLGELNWIFTAITDSIAWNMLPRALFQRLFRQVCPASHWWGSHRGRGQHDRLIVVTLVHCHAGVELGVEGSRCALHCLQV